MNLVDEEYVARLKVSENRGQIPRALDGRAGGDAHVDFHLVRHNMRQTGLAQSRRAIKQNVIQRLAALTRGLNQDAQVFFQAILAGKLGQQRRAQSAIKRGVFVTRLRGNRPIGHAFLSSGSSAADTHNLLTEATSCAASL
jgi:hypothetical protein